MMTVSLRAAVEPMSLVSQVRAAVAKLDPAIYAADVRTTRELVDKSVAKPRFVMLLLTGFAALALVLALVGTYGVLAYSVNQRRREIGIRMALGAGANAILRLIAGEGGRLAAYGLVIGLVVAAFATRVLEGMLFQVAPADPLAFGLTIILIAGTTMLATLIPALRASRVPSEVVLRGE
jgi:ABC-type antimicrobial peptide transport system permease subunit